MYSTLFLQTADLHCTVNRQKVWNKCTQMPQKYWIKTYPISPDSLPSQVPWSGFKCSSFSQGSIPGLNLLIKGHKDIQYSFSEHLTFVCICLLQQFGGWILHVLQRHLCVCYTRLKSFCFVHWCNRECCCTGLAAPPAAFSAPYVINTQEPYVGTLITGEFFPSCRSHLIPTSLPVLLCAHLSFSVLHHLTLNSYHPWAHTHQCFTSGTQLDVCAKQSKLLPSK